MHHCCEVNKKRKKSAFLHPNTTNENKKKYKGISLDNRLK